MEVNDKRVNHETGIFFQDLEIGQVYEDRDDILCIKTHFDDNQDNCISFVNGDWISGFEFLDAKVTPLMQLWRLRSKKTMIKCPNCSSTVQVKEIFSNYSTSLKAQCNSYKCKCGCLFSTRKYQDGRTYGEWCISKGIEEDEDE